MFAPSDEPRLICLTPMRNEAWVLDRFLRCASLWADDIVIADQMSDDGSRKIALRYPKVTLVDNKSTGYDEGERQRLVFERARQIPAGKRIFLAIDADEVISANWRESAEWQALRAAAPGTVIEFRWVNILPGFKKCWIPSHPIAMGFVDDGKSGHSAGQFHVPRLPMPAGAPRLVMNDVKVLHYQYTDWERMKSKQRGYQCSERVSNPAKRAIPLFRQYHVMDAFPPEQIHPMQDCWLEDYEKRGIDMRGVSQERLYRWDREIIEKFLRHGTGTFRKLNVWDRDWESVAKQLDIRFVNESLKDPRTAMEKRVHRWLASTQPQCMKVKVRAVQQALRLMGW